MPTHSRAHQPPGADVASAPESSTPKPFAFGVSWTLNNIDPAKPFEGSLTVLSYKQGFASVGSRTTRLVGAGVGRDADQDSDEEAGENGACKEQDAPPGARETWRLGGVPTGTGCSWFQRATGRLFAHSGPRLPHGCFDVRCTRPGAQLETGSHRAQDVAMSGNGTRRGPLWRLRRKCTRRISTGTATVWPASRTRGLDATATDISRGDVQSPRSSPVNMLIRP